LHKDPLPIHNERMARPGLQFSVAAMLGLIACAAVNIWLFRVGFLWGLIGLNVSKHVGVAVLCQVLGVNRRADEGASRATMSEPHATVNGVP
jgi:hypothetical protein